MRTRISAGRAVEVTSLSGEAVTPTICSGRVAVVATVELSTDIPDAPGAVLEAVPRLIATFRPTEAAATTPPTASCGAAKMRSVESATRAIRRVEAARMLPDVLRLE